MPKKPIRAVHALEEAQRIAFAPFVFQATITLKRMGVLNYIFENCNNGGVDLDTIAEALSISDYGLGVLMEIAESSNIVCKNEGDKYELTKTGYFLTCNKMTGINLNFTQNVCYQGLFHLQEAIETGRPAGLKELGHWPTIYEGLSKMAPDTQQSWFDFDHHYSDGIFDEALKIVFGHAPKLLFDIGGNTGKFAIQCCNYDLEVRVMIFDLPGQLSKALENAKNKGYENRISGREIDWLSQNTEIPQGADIIWMCQFLDCFSKQEILKILTSCAASMDIDTRLLIMETFTDRQKFDNARFILEATSLYFTTMANGNSKMYKAAELIELIDQAGLEIVSDIGVRELHTLFVCKKSNRN